MEDKEKQSEQVKVRRLPDGPEDKKPAYVRCRPSTKRKSRGWLKGKNK